MKYITPFILMFVLASCRQAGITKISATAQHDIVVHLNQDARQTAGQAISTKAQAQGSGGLLPK